MQPPRTAKYLLRFDDICPTMNWRVWSEIEASLTEYRLKPILAVVPDNRDPVLQVAAPAKDFWERARRWQARGWTIALHGFQHKYSARRAGIVTPKKLTEFAGVPAGEQQEKLRYGLEIFDRQGIKPTVWIAPNNSFDATTVSLLPKFGIRIICDGCFRFPFVDQQKIFWVPQQLFRFRPAPRGIWTVCYHHNRWTASDLEQFREGLRRFRADLWSLDDVLQTWADRRSWWSARLCTSPRFSQLLIRGELKLWKWRLSSRNPSGSVKPSFLPAEQRGISN
jgi:predicted deacetylase